MATTGRIYTRKSRHLGDPDDPELMAHHVAALQRLAAEQGIEIVEVIEEVGSGETIEQRPKFRALILDYEQCRTHDEALLVVELHRLSRGDLLEVGRIRNAFVQAGIRLLTPSRQYNLTDADDEFWFGFAATFGRHELATFKRRVAAKRQQMTREGRCVVAMVPFGYEWDAKQKQPAPHPDRFPILQAWCHEGLTDSTLVLAKRYEVPFRVVAATLRNPTICGYPARRTTRHPDTGNQVWLPRGQWLWPEKPGSYVAACTLSEWHALQEAIDARAHSRSATWHTDGWCKAVLQFHDGDGPLTGQVGCSTRGRSNRPADPTYELRRPLPNSRYQRLAFVLRADVHAAATEALSRLLERPTQLLEAMTRRQAEIASRAAHTDQERSQNEASLAAARRSLDAISRMEVEAEDLEHRDSLRRSREALVREVNRLKRLAPPLTSAALQIDAASLDPLVQAFDQEWPLTPDALKAVFVRELLLVIHVRVVSTMGARHAVREVVGWEYQPWLKEAAVNRRGGDA